MQNSGITITYLCKFVMHRFTLVPNASSFLQSSSPTTAVLIYDACIIIIITRVPSQNFPSLRRVPYSHLSLFSSSINVKSDRENASWKSFSSCTLFKSSLLHPRRQQSFGLASSLWWIERMSTHHTHTSLAHIALLTCILLCPNSFHTTYSWKG